MQLTAVVQVTVACLNADVAQVVVATIATDDEHMSVFDEKQELAVLSGDDVASRIADGWIYVQQALSDVEVHC